MCPEIKEARAISGSPPMTKTAVVSIDGGIATALSTLRNAASKDDPELICQAFEILRVAGGNITVNEALRLAGKVLGESATKIIVTAYAGRKCFMCANGTVQCRSCGGAGQIDEARRCASCDGLGLDSCRFCRGTGWADGEGTPQALKQAVTKRQLAAARKELDRLAKAFSGVSAKAIKKLSPQHTASLVAKMLQLHGQVSDLFDVGAITDQAERDRMAAAVASVDECLKLFRK